MSNQKTKNSRSKSKSKKKIMDKGVLVYELIGLLVVVLAFIAIGQFGKIGYNLAFIFKLLAGSWWYLLPLALIVMALLAMVKQEFQWKSFRNLGLLLLLLAILGYSQLNFFQELGQTTDTNLVSYNYKILVDNYKETTNNKAGGGLLGALVFSFLLFLFEFRGSQIILIFLFIVSLVLITKLTFKDSLDLARLLVSSIRDKFLARPKKEKKQNRKKEDSKNLIFDLENPKSGYNKDEEKKARDIEMVNWPQQIHDISSKTASPNLLSNYNISKIVSHIKDSKKEKNNQIISLKSNEDIIDRLKAQHLEKINKEVLEDQIEYIAKYHSQLDTDKPAKKNQISDNYLDTNPVKDQPSYSISTVDEFTIEDRQENNIPDLSAEGAIADPDDVQDYVFPQYNLLKDSERAVKNDLEIKDNARLLEETLKSFGVDAKVINHSVGPSVTRFELQPAVGVKVSKVLNLIDDIALALAAKEIRIEAPIPGKSAIGIEVPNKKKSMVRIREIIDSDEFRRAESKLSICLGKDVSGKAVVTDLSKMPHLLVAGSTGSGKSVCINTIIASIIYKASPDEVKMFLIDPKMVELNVYNGLPHLVTPVVTDPKQAAIILRRVVVEMERRYKLFANKRTKDLERYNQIIRQEKLAGAEAGEILPQIVVIIDELADLMLVSANDVEDAICRIAQMARAAGIHLIVATQRPSVDVITGLIKANIPSRIAFTVASQTDSRTILDMGGAERLLGMGDMLFLPAGVSKPIRVQGAFISEEEIDQMVNFVKLQNYSVQENESLEDFNNLSNQDSKSIEIEDEFYEDAVRLVVEAGQASASYLQRRLKIGYARAARLIDYMEEEGIVSPYEGNKPREVYLTPEQLDSRE